MPRRKSQKQASQGSGKKADVFVDSHPVPKPEKIDRPQFPDAVNERAILMHNLTGEWGKPIAQKQNLDEIDASKPHRMSWADIRDNTQRFHLREESQDDFIRWTDRFLEAGQDRINSLATRVKQPLPFEHEDYPVEELGVLPSDDEKKLKAEFDKNFARLRELSERSQAAFQNARDAYAQSPTQQRRNKFLKEANSFHANVPDIGPHNSVNNPVRERAHLHLLRSSEKPAFRAPSPMSRRVLAMSPGRLRAGVATNDAGEIITVTGETFLLEDLEEDQRDLVERHKPKDHNASVVGNYNPKWSPFVDKPPR